MLKKYLQYFKKSDWVLSGIVIFLILFGLATIYSIEVTADEPDYLNFKKQLLFVGIGLVLYLIFSLSDYRFLKTYSLVFYVIGAILLVLVLIFGETIRGTRGWFVLFNVQGFQPVEISKIILVIFLSKLLVDWKGELYRRRNFIIYSSAASFLIILVLLQPDVGSALILVSIFLGMLFFAKVKSSYVIFIIALLIIVVAASWLFVLKDYQKDRVLTFFDPSRDPWGSGYNITQSIIAVGSGNLFGRGLGLGPQSRLDFLPAQETDFIFAVIAEELGFVGSILIVAFFIFLLYRLIKIGKLARDDFGLFVASGIALYFFIQTFINIGMNIGLVPIAGVPLPLMSYGGSSLLTSLVAIGILQSIFIRHRT